jgi:hypothetical protein
MDRKVVDRMAGRWPKRGRCFALLLAFDWLSCCGVASGQFQFLPEVDAYDKLSSNVRFDFQAKDTREAGDPTQAEVGPSFDFYLKPLVKLKHVTEFDMNDAKSRLLQLSLGFRDVPSPDKPHIERMIAAFTMNFPLRGNFLLSDRNRADLDWEKGEFTWRYRNRLNLERTITVGSYHPSPYVAVEPYYLSQYQKWSTTALYAGCILPFKQRYELEPYYEHQNITSKRPNQQLEQFGLILNMYFGP